AADHELIAGPCGERIHACMAIAEAELQLVVRLADVEEFRTIDTSLARRANALINEVVPMRHASIGVNPGDGAGESASRCRATGACIAHQMESALDLGIHSRKVEAGTEDLCILSLP